MRRLDEEDEDEKEDKKSPEPQSSPVQKALFKSRTVLIFGEVDMKMAERVTAQLLAYAAEGEGDIRVIVNSPGGHVESGDTIHDMIRFVGPRVKMIGTGWVASAGAHIYPGREKGEPLLPADHALPAAPALGRRARPGFGHLHRGRGDPQDARAVEPHHRAETGQPYEKVVADTERNFWMGAEEAKAYGLVCKVDRSARARCDGRDALVARGRRSIRSISAASATAMATGRAISPA